MKDVPITAEAAAGEAEQKKKKRKSVGDRFYKKKDEKK